MKIEIKNRFTLNVLFSYECEENTILKTVNEALKKDANLRSANLQGADLQDANLQGADLRGADLRGAYLQGAYLQDANLQGADLRGADLQGAYLQDANLQGADLRGANLQGADLRGADLQGADLDFSCLPLFCGSLRMKTDKRIRVQVAFHFLSLIKYGIDVTDEEKVIFEKLKGYANNFHRTDVEKF